MSGSGDLQAAAAPNRPITLSQWIALNDELVALSRAGVPLDVGLRRFAAEIPGRLGAIADHTSSRLEAGVQLDQVFADTSVFPASYRAIIQAGTRTGKLPIALEGLSSALRRIKDLRRWAIAGALYPSIVVFIWYWVFLFHISKPWHNISRYWKSIGLEPTWYTSTLDFLSRTCNSWWWWPPLVFIFVWIVVLIRATRASLGHGSRWSFLPGFGKHNRLVRLASFTDLLALLVEYQVPIPDALEIAGDSQGDTQLTQASHELAQKVRSGILASRREGPLPAWIKWLTTAGLRTNDLVRGLQMIGKSYRHQADVSGRWMTSFFPAVLSLVLGGSLILIYGLFTFGPWSKLMLEISLP